MADNISVTPGAGAVVATDEVGGNHFQRMKLAAGQLDSADPIPGDSIAGLWVNAKRVEGNVTVVQPNASLLKVDASTVPLTINDGGGSLTIDAGGSSLPVNDGGNILSVEGAVIAAQGTPAGVASGWPVKITDGADIASIATAFGVKALRVVVVDSISAFAFPDKTFFQEGLSRVGAVGGVVNDTLLSDLGEDTVGSVRLTPRRAFHVNLRTTSGIELGTASNPIRVDPTGTTPVTVSGTISTNVRDDTGAPFSELNPLPVCVVPSEGTQFKAAVTYGASQADQTIFAPAAAKKFLIEMIIITVTVSGNLKIFDNTNLAINMIYQGTPPAGAVIVIQPSKPISSVAANNILRYTTGTAAVGDITVKGYEV